ncbi:DUF4856 domain-containing protein [Flavobacterium sp. NRK F7]|uniref:DUF4856 domain-containing protein n=1 Tax=Flavobacterium sp. NRK F7 TaxID=2954930 RepID=UPI0020910188|nr:DUF4856 domain-containing protein [Flavobacterium sp. NRK F7]MCO6163772.1 DUF4856 domain-containing protein [Flavobacterium sp. NRK F7]
MRTIIFSKIVLSFLCIGLLSCSSDDNGSTTDSVTVPETYEFNRNNQTTVDFSGQSNRILMLTEMGNYIKNQGVAGNQVDVTVLSNMYANENNPFSTTEMNTSGKELKDKTAASKDYFVYFGGGGSTLEQAEVRTFFESQFTDANAASQGNNASENVAGKYQDGTSIRLFAANGLEPQQVLLKGLMGACFMDQIVNNYLSTTVLDEANNKINNSNKVLESGKNYTKMEHLWDEAYGYIYGAGGGKFWDSYINQVNADADFNTVKAEIELAFRKGRAAIVANNYTVRDEQIAIIKARLALVPAVRAVFYLKEGKAKLITDNGAKAFHALSEAYGFIMALRYTNNPTTNAPYFSKAEVDSILSDLTAGTNGLWDVDYLNTKLDELATTIATRFSFTVAQAEIVN